MTYGTLKTSVAGYLHRSDLTSQIPDFIDQARTRIGGELRARCNYVTGSVTSFSGGVSALPTNLSALVAVTQDGYALTYQPSEQILWNAAGGVYSTRGGDLVVPSAGSTSTVVLAYYAIPTALSSNSDVALGMVEYPQLWIYASVVEGATYCQDWDLAERFDALYQALLQNANRMGLDARIGPAPSQYADQPMLQSMASL